ncbi:MAG: Glycosyl transferase family 2, partial [Parcubacteria group bacterium GW2011_GWA2_47_8]
HAEKSLKDGGYLVIYLPNLTQMQKSLASLKGAPFKVLDIIELLERKWAINEQIMRPVLKRTVGMSIAIQNRRAYFLNYLFVTKVLRLVPVLAGQRVLSKALWSKLPRWYKQNFRIEVGLNFYSKFYANGYQYRAFSELGQTVKERKYGLVRGLAHRLAMTFDIMAAQIKLYALEVPQTIKARRIAFFGALGNAVGALVGAALIWIARIGPLAALHQFFAHRLAEGHTIYFVDFLTRSATVASKELIASIGIAIVLLNVLGLIINIRRVVSLIRARR